MDSFILDNRCPLVIIVHRSSTGSRSSSSFVCGVILLEWFCLLSNSCSVPFRFLRKWKPRRILIPVEHHPSRMSVTYLLFLTKSDQEMSIKNWLIFTFHRVKVFTFHRKVSYRPLVVYQIQGFMYTKEEL